MMSSREEIERTFEAAQIKHLTGNIASAEGAYKTVLNRAPAHHGALLGYARLLLARQNFPQAIKMAERLEALHGADPDAQHVMALVAKLEGRLSDAIAHGHKALSLRVDFLDVHQILSSITMAGPSYRDILKRAHAIKQPRTYLEIGIETGSVLTLAAKANRAFGVDPDPQLAITVPANTQIFQETSDAFFSSKAAHLFSQHPLDMCFIDGMHEARFAFRDFVNAEKWSSPEGVIFMHDVFPLDEPSQRPDRETCFWAGDVWKSLMAIMSFFPDLTVTTISSPPSGIALITGLNPQRDVLPETVWEAYRFMQNFVYADIEQSKSAALNVTEITLDDLPSLILPD